MHLPHSVTFAPLLLNVQLKSCIFYAHLFVSINLLLNLMLMLSFSPWGYYFVPWDMAGSYAPRSTSKSCMAEGILIWVVTVSCYDFHPECSSICGSQKVVFMIHGFIISWEEGVGHSSMSSMLASVMSCTNQDFVAPPRVK